jgi:hypothetical protein
MALNLTGREDGNVLLKERYRIKSEEPLPGLDTGSARAFAAAELQDAGRRLYALVGDSKQPPRHDIIATLRRIYHKNLVGLVDWGVAEWPASGRRLPILILERPAGPRLMPADGSEITPFREDRISQLVIPPMAQVLLELHKHGLTHRNLNPENMFYDGPASDQTPILLGDCVAAPAANRQPAVYEPIEFAMADPAGRGEGTAANDLYALGVTIVSLLLGRRPMHDMSDDEVLAAKLARGSYVALIGEQRVSGALMEVLRGLLSDDPGERWTLEELEHWINGRRLSPRQQMISPRAARPFEFNGAQLYTAREVASAFAANWDAAASTIGDQSLDVWLRRSLKWDDRIEAVNLANSWGVEHDSNGADGALARTCIALDPIAPIRLRRFRANLGGFGQLLAAYYHDAEMQRDFKQVFAESLPLFWLELCLRPSPQILRTITTYDRLRSALDRTGMGGGIERALYELNPTVPCQSPLLADDFVVALDQLLPALERKAARDQGAFDVLIDRDIAAFVAVRLKYNIPTELRDLEDERDPYRPAIAAARIYAIVQEETGAPPAPGFCAIVARHVQNSVERYHSRDHRARAAGQLADAAKSGVLASILAIVDNKDALEEDHMHYQVAMAEYRATLAEQSRIEFEREHRGPLSRQLGAELAALISGAVSTLAILVVVLAKLF